MLAIAERLRTDERRALAAQHLARAARLWPPTLEERRAETLAALAETYPTQFRSQHVMCLVRADATVEERTAIATALLAGTGLTISPRSAP